MLHSEDNQCVCTISEIMVLGLRTKNRKGVFVKVDYIVHVQEIKPWTPSQSLRSVQSMVFQWEKRRVLKKTEEEKEKERKWEKIVLCQFFHRSIQRLLESDKIFEFHTTVDWLIAKLFFLRFCFLVHWKPSSIYWKDTLSSGLLLVGGKHGDP